MRLEIPDGEPLPGDASQLHAVMAQILITHSADLETLRSGAYDITPRIWTRNTHRHELTVFDNGEGIYRILPITENVGYHVASNAGINPYAEGGRTQPLNATQPLHIIGGGHPRKSELQIFGLILYV